MDDALKAAKDAIKAGGSAKYNGKIHTSLASLLGVDEESEDSGQADVAALNSDLEEARFRLKESQESREYWYNAHKEQAEELDFVRTELERTKLSLDDSNDALKAKTDENKVKDKEITDLKAQIEKLKTEVTEAKKPKAEKHNGMKREIFRGHRMARARGGS